jgi:hypothetical protein
MKSRLLVFSVSVFFCNSIYCQNNSLRSDTVNIDLKNISSQLITLRDSIGVELMSLDKRLVRATNESRVNLEKSKCKLNVYRAELEKLIEELTQADISYITDIKKRSYRTVLDVRREFIKVLAETKVNNSNSKS